MSHTYNVYLLVATCFRAYCVTLLTSPLISFFFLTVLRNKKYLFCRAITMSQFLLNKVVFSDNQRTTLPDFRDRLLLLRLDQAVRNFFYFELILTLLRQTCILFHEHLLLLNLQDLLRWSKILAGI